MTFLRPEPPTFEPPVNLCRGGCGKPMPRGQKCMACATRAVEAWKANRQKERTR